MLLLPVVASAQGKLYERYASRADLTVAQVSGFRLNDTARVDVVLVVADDAAAWQRLARELDIRESEGVTSWLGAADQPARRARWTGAQALRVVASPERRSVGFYIIENEGQYDALLDYQLNQTVKNKKK